MREYVPDSKILQNFIENPYNVEYVNALARDILKFINYKGNLPEVKYGILGNNLSDHAFNRATPIITITSQPRYSPQILISLIIRECIHLYIYDRKIDYVPNYLPEENADVYAVYMGFYNFLTNGYHTIGHTNKKRTKICQTTCRQI